MPVLIAYAEDTGFYVISAQSSAPVLALWFSSYDAAVETCEAAGFTVISYEEDE